MKYKLDFLTQALKEWKALDRSIQTQFKKKLQERLENPHQKLPPVIHECDDADRGALILL